MLKYLDNHEQYMQFALDLAKKGIGYVSPNPLVGCVIVKEGRVIGEGYHNKFGGNHAEVNALNNCIESPVGASLYVNLEPCHLHGQTPPCTKTIIENSISDVYIGAVDLNPDINQLGISDLENAGIKVHTNILYNHSYNINKYFFKWITKKHPYVIGKVAQTKDGYMGFNSDKSIWITGDDSKLNVHKLRSRVDAIMIGKNTALVDNPKLTVRKTSGINPKRIVVDTNRSLPLHLNIFTDKESSTYVLCSNQKFTNSKTSFCTYLTVNEIDKYLDPLSILEILGKEGITSVLLEGGSRLLNSFYKADLIDEIHIYTGNKVINGANLINPLKIDDNWDIIKTEDFDKDHLLIAKKKILCLQES